MTYTIAVCTVKNSWWWTEKLSETFKVLFQKLIWEISASSLFYYKNLSRCTVNWTSNSIRFWQRCVTINIMWLHELPSCYTRIKQWKKWQHTTFLTFCWPCISVYLSQYLTNLMNKICSTISFISCLYMFRAHVLIRRTKLHYIASGIITPIGVMIPEAI